MFALLQHVTAAALPRHREPWPRAAGGSGTLAVRWSVGQPSGMGDAEGGLQRAGAVLGLPSNLDPNC